MATTPTLLAVTWFLLDHGSLLMERCPKKGAAYPEGEWFVPGGKIEPGETPEEACRREIGEEWPGVSVEALEALPTVEGRDGLLLHPFVVGVRGPIPTHAANGTPLRWVPLREALDSPVAEVRAMVSLIATRSGERCTEPSVRRNH